MKMNHNGESDGKYWERCESLGNENLVCFHVILMLKPTRYNALGTSLPEYGTPSTGWKH